MMNIIILDDQKAQIEEIEKQLLLLNIDDIEIHKYQNEDILMKNIKTIPEYSIFLIDIVLNQNSGIEVAKMINEQVRGAIVIFISSFLDKVVDIYDAQHYYFIYKPELKKRLPIALNKAINSLNQIKETLPIVLKGKTVILHPADILYLERDKHITIIKDTSQMIKCPYKLEELFSKLPTYFIRCHRSYIINAQKVIARKRDEFMLEDSTSIPISRAYQKEVENKFQEYLMNKL